MPEKTQRPTKKRREHTTDNALWLSGEPCGGAGTSSGRKGVQGGMRVVRGRGWHTKSGGKNERKDSNTHKKCRVMRAQLTRGQAVCRVA